MSSPILKVSCTQNEFMRTSIFQNSNKNIVWKVFIASLGLPGIFFGLLVGFFIYHIT